MGAGKSTLGLQVAKLLNVLFLDTDQMIEEKTGMPISNFFESKGEKVFRHLEDEAIRETVLFEKAIVATGGGLPMHSNNMQWLTQHGITIYLQWQESQLISFLLTNRASRPLLSKLADDDASAKIKNLIAERSPIYDQAAMTIEMTGVINVDLETLEKACKYIW